jgi:subtilase family serine protease
MSWGGGEVSGETAYDGDMSQGGTFYTASAGDSGHGAEYPAASPNVIAVGGTTLNGCSGTSCAGFTSETTWSGSGGGASAVEPVPGYQSSYAAGKTALQGHSAIYSGGYATNLKDITSGTNGTCGTDCTAGSGYDLVTGLGSPVNYP